MTLRGSGRTVRLGVAGAVVAGTVVTGDVAVDAGTGTIAAVGLASDGPADAGIAAPGLVDLQVNGFAGVDFRACAPDDYARASLALAACGVTACMPTFFSCSVEECCDALAVLRAARVPGTVGARLLDAHLEGPFISPVRTGMHDVGVVRHPTRELVDRLLDAGPVGMLTFAPELDGALELVGPLVEQGVVVGVGHTDATAAVVRAAVDAGARHLTHCWNAHRPLAARDPGPAGLALTDERVTVGLIADGVHVSPEIALLTFAAAPGRVAITADAVPLAGLAHDASWDDRGRTVVMREGAARLPDGALAGGVRTPDEMLRAVVELGIPLAAALDACGGAQRRLLGLAPVELRPGDIADVVVLDDDLRPIRTLVGGIEVWRSG